MSGVQMSLGTIIKKAKTFVKELWGLDFDISVELSGKMTRTLGYVAYKPDWKTGKHIPTKMKIAARLVSGDYKEETIDGVILHECCHFAMMKLNKPDADGHPVFEAELRRIGASSTRTIKSAGNVNEFCCSKCGKSLGGFSDQKAKSILKRMNDPYRIVRSKCCKADIVYKGKSYKEDNNKTRQAFDGKAQEVKAAMSIAQPEVTTKKNHIVVPNGPNGKVTNNTMIPILKELLNSNNMEGIKELKNKYPNVFESSKKYFGKKDQNKMATI
mgnify:CR=1 FL=1